MAIIGPRQCGKTTLARHITAQLKKTVHLDLERNSDIAKLQDPEAYFSFHADELICLDEIQRLPDIFPLIRAMVDDTGRSGRFLILGSASPDLLKQSSETLAGRISYIELTPFLLNEISADPSDEIIREMWLRGGFPKSWLQDGLAGSLEWRLDFIKTFLERDVPALGFQISAKKLERFWQMCAHVQGQPLNSSKLGGALDLSHHTVRNYVDLLEHAFILRVLHPYSPNLKKRLIKSPKIYIRDTGLLHALLGVETHDDLMGHPSYGLSWETFAIENILPYLRNWRVWFYRTAAGTEIDLVVEKNRRRIAFECKASTSPKVGRGFWNALDDLKITDAFVVAPVKASYPIEKNVMVTPLGELCRRLKTKGL